MCPTDQAPALCAALPAAPRDARGSRPRVLPSPAGLSEHLPETDRFACSRSSMRWGPAAAPGTGEKRDVAVWPEAVFLPKKSGCRAPRTELCDVFPAWRAPCRPGVPGPECEVLGRAWVRWQQRADGPGHRRKGRYCLMVAGTRLQDAKRSEKTEQPIVSFLNLEVHLVSWPHIVL